jgi:hypothetical protein
MLDLRLMTLTVLTVMGCYSFGMVHLMNKGIEQNNIYQSQWDSFIKLHK